MRKRAFRLRSVVEGGRQPVVGLTYNLQDIQPWKQTTPRYQTSVYVADAGGLAVTRRIEGPIDYRNEDLARQGHAAMVATRRKDEGAGDR